MAADATRARYFEVGPVGSRMTRPVNMTALNSWIAYQTVTRPQERTIWWRIPTLGPWQEFDLKKYFTNGQAN